VATIDDKVVAMSFESSKFESGVNKALNALERLKAALKFPEAGKGLEEIGKSAKKVDLGFIGRAIDSLKGKLAALRLVGIGVLTNIANHAVAAGARFVKAFTLDPVLGGLREYETKLNAVQTILANTQAAGTTLKQVNATLKELNEFSDKTIYNFGQMAKNIGTFTAAGVDIKTATGAIKGIANLAALSGSNAEQAATAMYQLSQAISAGRVGLQDWNSVVNAGMGGTVFQRALAQTAVAMGTLKENSLKLVGPMKNVSINGESFRQSMQAGPGKTSWLSSKVLTTTLKQFTGDLSKAELAAIGFNDAQIKSIQQTARTAMHAATEVKTLTQVLSVAKETAESGWAETWQIILGDFGEAKKTFTDLSNTINGFINANADARNKVLADWKALGGRRVLIDSIKTSFQALGDIIRPIKEAFRDVFPAKTGKDLYNLTLGFKAFAEALKPSPETIENLKRTFRGFFAILSIGKQIIGGIFTVFGSLFGALDGAGGGFLAITARIGDWLYSVDQALKKGERLNKFFEGIGAAIAVPIEILKEFAQAIQELFGFDSGGISDQVNGMTEAMTPFQKATESLTDALDSFLDTIGSVGSILRPVYEAYVQFLGSLGPAISQAISSMNFEALLAVIRTGLFAGLVLMFKQFIGKGSLIEQLLGGLVGAKGLGGPFGALTGMFQSLGGTLQAYQTNLKAKTLREIALAVALLVASIVALSFVDPKKLNSAMAAMTIALGQLVGAMVAIEKLTTMKGFIKLPVVTASMILLAGALLLLTGAVVALSFLSWEELAKGLGSIVVLLGALVVASGPLGANSVGMIRAGVGITALAVALNLLAIAVKIFATMSWGDLAKGLGAVAASLVIIANAMKIMPRNLVLTGTGLIAVGVGLNIIALAIRQMGSMDLVTIGKGLGAIAGSLVIIGLAMKLMPKGMVLQAAALVLISLALQGIAKAVASMGGMSIEQIAKGLGTLAGALIILAGALHIMQGAVGGAIALGIVSGGLALLTPALIALGRQKWGNIIKGLASLAAALGLIGIAALLLQPAVPAMLGLGAALVLIGAGLALAGAGIALIGVGLSAIAVSGPIAIGVLLQAFIQFQKGIIENAKLIITGVLQIVTEFAKAAPQFVDALVKILSSVLDAFIRLSPKIAQAVQVLLDMMLRLLAANQDKIIQAGFDLLLALLAGIQRNLPQIVRMVTLIIATLLNSLARNVGRIVSAGLNVLVNFIKGIVNNVSKLISAGISIITAILRGIANSVGKVITAAASVVTALIRGIANNASKIVTAGASAIAKFITGIANAGQKLITAGVNAAAKLINGIVTGILRLIDVGARAIIRFLNGVADAIDKYEPQMIAAGLRIGKAIVTGMIRGLAAAAPELLRSAGKLVDDLKNKALKKLKLRSPSKVFEEIGQNIVLGLAIGISDTRGAVAATETMANSVIDTTNEIFQTASPSKVMEKIGKFVGQGFAQGLRGSQVDIRDAFAEMNQLLTDAQKTAREGIAKEQSEINEARASKSKADNKTIGESRRAIQEYENALKRLSTTKKLLNVDFDKQHAKLSKLAKQYAIVADKLKKARDALEEAKRVREEAREGFAEQYKELPEIVRADEEGKALTGAEQLALFTAALEKQVAAVASYRKTLGELRKLGLDEDIYKRLLDEGTINQDFASALLAGGETAVEGVNKLEGALETEATTLANNAAASLYDAGVSAAQGLVNGLESELANITKSMDKIAKAMVKAIKKALKIKSPSEIFAEMGKFTAEGMANGITDSAKTVTDAVYTMADDAANAMRDSLNKIAFGDLIDTRPVITPVLDLSLVQMEAKRMADMVSSVGTTSFGKASVISSEQQEAAREAEATAIGGTAIKFEQNNYSPESLSAIEIYRQTRNQLSQFKTALGVT
jgi:tape measure domain-containing protein